MDEFVEVATTSEIPTGGQLVVMTRGREVALFNVDGRVHAIDNICSHQGGPLGEGEFKGSIVRCPWHAWTFEVTTGVCTFHGEIKVEVFDVQVRGDRILVRVP